MTTTDQPIYAFDEAQAQVDAWIAQFEEGYFPPLVQIARLCEELGELARAVSHQQKTKKPKPDEPPTDVEEEFGDLLFVMACFANSQNISMAQAFQKTLNKIKTRDTTRWTPKINP